MPQKPDWTNDPLYKAFKRHLPAYVKADGALNVYKLAEDLGRSYETVYKWFRYASAKAAADTDKRAPKPVGKIKPHDIQDVIALAALPANADLLAASGKKPPRIETFAAFAFA